MRLGMLAAGMITVLAAHAQKSLPPAPEPERTVRERVLSTHFPSKPSLSPAFSIPVEPIGFSAPGPLYLGQRNSIASLDFLDEDRLLFTFRVPGLLRRKSGEEDERQIRAVVLRISTGAVEAQALWTLHDRSRYLWMLAGGHFLLRDNNELQIGDASLALKPFLKFPGSLLSLRLSPSEQLLLTNSREPVKTAAAGAHSASAETGSSKDSDDSSQENQPASGEPDLVLRVLNRSSGEVEFVHRVRQLTQLAINSAGYLEDLSGKGDEWVVSLSGFSGGSKILSEHPLQLRARRGVHLGRCSSGHRLLLRWRGPPAGNHHRRPYAVGRSCLGRGGLALTRHGSQRLAFGAGDARGASRRYRFQPPGHGRH